MFSHLFWASISLLFIGAEISAQGSTEQWCALKFNDCGSPKGKLNSATYNGTCEGGKAVLKKGTVAGINFVFQANEEEATLSSKVAGKIGIAPFINFPLDNPNACLNSGLKCPVPGNKVEQYKPALRVLEEFPSLNVYVKWQLQDKNGQDVFCAILLATITS